MLPDYFYRYAFAKPLKQALEVLGIKEPKTRAEKEALLPGRKYSYRKAAQTLGTEWARALDPSFWGALAQENIAGKDYVVVTDVRFENEANLVRELGGHIWHISGRKAELLGDTASHESERPVDFKDGDSTIQNTGSLQDLDLQVQKLLGELDG
jgi:hypothetical protein